MSSAPIGRIRSPERASPGTTPDRESFAPLHTWLFEPYPRSPGSRSLQVLLSPERSSAGYPSPPSLCLRSEPIVFQLPGRGVVLHGAAPLVLRYRNPAALHISPLGRWSPAPWGTLISPPDPASRSSPAVRPSGGAYLRLTRPGRPPQAGGGSRR